MDVGDKIKLVKEVGEEILTEEELKTLFETKKNPVAYDGFEPSGKIHLAQGILRTININKMLKAGVRFKMLVADWHGWANNKMGGDLEKINVVGSYFMEVWKATGLDMDKVKFYRSSDVMSSPTYWKTTMQIARKSTLPRIVRCSQIMGRKESDSLTAAQIFYPCMQTADIFEMKADIAQLGMDQRKVNVLAREVGPALGHYKPVIVSHHMLMGLTEPPKTNLTGADKAIAMKMSKSNPDSAIFMTDSTEEIKRKIKKAYCPAKQVNENPIMEYCKYIIFESFPELKIERPTKFGGDLEFKSYDELSQAFAKGDLHPLDLKTSVSHYVDLLIDPVRKHFEKKKPKALLEQVQSFEVTR